MNIIKITDIANEIVEKPVYIQTSMETNDIEGLIAAFQYLISVYTEYCRLCSITKDMVTYLLVAFCDCELIVNTSGITADKWIDLAETLLLHNGNNELYLSHIRTIKRTEFFKKICNFFDDPTCIDCVNMYSLKTILNRY